MCRKSWGSGASRVVLLAIVACVIGPVAGALDILDLDVNHINLDDQHPMMHSSAAISSQMCLRFLGSSDETLLEILNYGRSLDPTFTPALELDADMLVGTMDNYVPDPDYLYEVIHGSDFTAFVGQIGYWLNRNIPDVSPNPVNAPAMIPLGGDWDNWVVVTGTRSDDDPFLTPGTTMYGLWLDDCRINDNGGMNETNIFYSTEPTASPSLVTSFVPMTTGPYVGEYVAVVPVAPATLGVDGVPGATMVLLMVAGVVCLGRLRRGDA
ncbi:MAG: hypothetical protein GY851_01620 [bacterium]|nr:hypothetical protein [bacterium]